jgi:hypothetical protein
MSELMLDEAVAVEVVRGSERKERGQCSDASPTSAIRLLDRQFLGVPDQKRESDQQCLIANRV